LLDHRYLNEVPGLENPTSEHLARFILERMRVPGATISSVSVAETCTSRCTVYADEA
jgi:6-pyruvoyltetrahydropterin/6-carboxytetrahydropterin synthase